MLEELHQFRNSRIKEKKFTKEVYSLAVAIDTALLSSVDFSGLIRVETTRDNDFVEFVFSFQDSSNFYAVYSSKSGTK